MVKLSYLSIVSANATAATNVELSLRDGQPVVTCLDGSVIAVK